MDAPGFPFDGCPRLPFSLAILDEPRRNAAKKLGVKLLGK